MRRGRTGEFELIQRLRKATVLPAALRSAVLTGIGDDAAVLANTPGRVLLATTDLLAEGIHFNFAWTDCRQLGYKATMVNFSDLAAMGGIPRFVLISLAVPTGRSARDIEALYAGISAACRPAGATVVGGDTSGSRSELVISVTVLGEAPPRELLRRSAARPGDRLYVTGTLGDAKAGLEILSARKRGRTTARHAAYLTGRHLKPAARLREGRLLAAGRLAGAAIDLSDGLAGDVRHICEESRVGCVIDLRRLPVSPALKAYARGRNRDALGYALSGGEDYELLFTVSPTKVARVEALIRLRQLNATSIGRIMPAREGLHILTADGDVRPLSVKGYEHRLG